MDVSEQTSMTSLRAELDLKQLGLGVIEGKDVIRLGAEPICVGGGGEFNIIYAYS